MKKIPTDLWSIREKLALASAVIRSGDQNWVSVSRNIKPFLEPERSNDWFSQINCARQYEELLENVETPKRKRGEKDIETPGEIILRKLTIERTEELKALIQEEAEKYKLLKSELEKIKSGHLHDQMNEIWESICLQTNFQKVTPDDSATLTKEEDVGGTTNDSISTNDKDLKEETSTTSLCDNDLENDVKEDIIEGDQDQIDQMQVLNEEKSQIEDQENVESSIKMENDFIAIDNNDSDDIVISTEEIIDDIEECNELSLKDIPSTPTNICDTIDNNSNEKVELNDFVNVIEPKNESNDEVIAEVEQVNEVVAGDVDDSEQNKNTEILSDNADVSLSEVKQESIETTEKVDTTIKDQSATDTTLPPSNDHPQPIASSTDHQLDESDQPPEPSNQTKEITKDYEIEIKTSTDSAILAPVNDEEMEVGKESEISSKKSTTDDEEDYEDGRGKSNDSTSLKLSTSSLMLLKPKMSELNESVPNSPASVCNSDTEDERAHKVWKKSIMLVWRGISNHKFANIFMHPVTEDIAPGYHLIVYKPMDLNTIRKNIDIGVIRTTSEFQRDMMLMFTNAIMYNHSSHDVHKMALEMYKDSMVQIEQFVSTQMMVNTEPKLLRTLRRSDVGFSDKEDDLKKKRIIELETGTQINVKKRKH